MSLRRRDKLALAFSPVFLRIALGVTFLWAGSGKLFSERVFDGNDTALLASMGVELGGNKAIKPPVNVAPATNTAPAATPTLAPPGVPIPDPPKTNQPKNRQSKPGKGERPARDVALTAAVDLDNTRLIALQTPSEPEIIELPGATRVETRRPQTPAAGTTPSVTPAPQAGTPASARRLYDLALLLKRASLPRPGTTSTMTLWPDWAAGGSWPVYFAWTAALAEIVCGCCLLAGLFTRIGAITLALIMLNAMWLTELGPALQAGKTILWIIPAREDGEFFAIAVWQRWMWQLALMCSAAALTLLGPGPLSLDHAVFSAGGGGGGGGDEPEPKPKPGK